LLVIAGFAAGLARAHPANFTQAHLVVDEDGTFTLSVNLDLLALAADVPAADATDELIRPLLDEPRETLARQLAEAGERLRREVIVKTDQGVATITEWRVADLAEVKRVLGADPGSKPLLPWMGEITGAGRLPEGTTSVSLRVAYVVGKIVTVFELPGAEAYGEPVGAGEFSSALPVTLAKHDTLAGRPGAESVDKHPSRWVLCGRYIVIGFEHIVPQGLDHILFVLGLFLLGSRLRPLLWQVSAFTVAHSITLGLSLYGVVSLPASVVEPIIAASIAFIAIENLFTVELKPWRPLVVFVFGLIHGLGFAGALAEIGLPRQDYALGLIGFNVGVECGQLAVITAAFLAVGWLRAKPVYRKAVVFPASALIALVALVWTVGRIFGAE
jgi:hypothetical protein